MEYSKVCPINSRLVLAEGGLNGVDRGVQILQAAVVVAVVCIQILLFSFR